MLNQLLIFCFILGVTPQQIQAEEQKPHLHYHTLPIYGNASLGYYYVKLFVGGP